MKSVKRKPIKNKNINKPRKKHDTRQTRTAGGGLFDRLHAYRDHHAHALFSSLGRLVAKPFSTMMTVAVLALSIALASSVYIIFINAQQLTANLDAGSQISLFLKESINDEQASDLAKEIAKNPDVQQINSISKEQALAEFKTYSGFGSAIDLLEKNPLPIVLQVLPNHELKDKQALENLLHSLEKFDQVDNAQFDMQWVERLQSIVEVTKYGAILFTLMIGTGVLFIIGNTIRLELQSRKEEVVIAKLVGATNSFIRRPFLYTGFWLGFISGIVAWIIVTALMLVLRQSVEKLSKLYEGNVELIFLSVTDTLALLGLASVLGVISSWVVLIYQLHRAKPE